MIKSLNILVAVAAIGLSLPAAANSDFEREMARTDGDYHGTSATTAKDSKREPAKPMTREDIAFLQELARSDGGTVEPIETPSGTAVAVR